MNINEFLKNVDTSTEQMTKKELEDFVHLLARKTGETQREKFIQYLSIANKPIQNKENAVATIKSKITYVLKEFKVNVIDTISPIITLTYSVYEINEN